MSSERNEQSTNELNIRINEFDSKTALADSRLLEATRALGEVPLSQGESGIVDSYARASAYQEKIKTDIRWIGVLTEYALSSGLPLEDLLRIWDAKEQSEREAGEQSADNSQS